jgi:hypothetical protein
VKLAASAIEDTCKKFNESRKLRPANAVNDL